MAGGRFDNLEHAVALSGDVCALVALKTVVTGDTIMIAPDKRQGELLQQLRAHPFVPVSHPLNQV